MIDVIRGEATSNLANASCKVGIVATGLGVAEATISTAHATLSGISPSTSTKAMVGLAPCFVPTYITDEHNSSSHHHRMLSS